MAVASFTTFADNTEQTVLAAPCRVTAIEILPHPQQANTVFVQLFDATNPDLAGGAAADTVIPVPSASRQGAGTAAKNGNTAYRGQKKQKVVFPNGGLRFGTGCTIMCSTTSTAYTAATTTSLPSQIRVFYVIGG